MACDRMRELALLSVDGELTEPEKTELAAHLESCADCRAAQAAAARVAEGVRQLAPPPVPLGFAERTLKRLDEASMPRKRPRPLPWIVPVAAAAATIVAVAVFLVERNRPTPPDGSLVASETKAPPAAEPEGAREGGEKEGFALDAPARKAEVEAPADETKRLGLEDEKQPEQEEQLKLREAWRTYAAGDLLAQLAEGKPADALRRIDELPRDGRFEEGFGRDLESNLEKERSVAKDDEDAAKHRATVPPALRFLRVKGDARRIDELLARELRNWKAPQDFSGRSVVDLDADAAKSLRERLTAAGLVCEELPAAEWLRAAQAAAANEGLLARSDKNKNQKKEAADQDREKKSEERKREPPAEAPPEARRQEGAQEKAKGEKGEERAADAAGPAGAAGKAGAAAPAAPATAAPRRVERCFFLIQR